MSSDYAMEADRMAEHRRRYFKIEVKPARGPCEPNEICLSVTYNDSQWHSIALTPIERLKVIQALLKV